MAIDANILLRGIVPDATAAVRQGLAAGSQIREGQARGKQIQAEEGERLALTMNRIFGNAEITPELYAQGLQAAQELGVPISPDRAQFTPENAAFASRLSKVGAQVALAKGGLTRRVQSVHDLGGGSARIFFNDGTVKLVTGTEAENAIVSAGQDAEIDFQTRLSAGKAGGAVSGRVGAEAETVPTQVQTQGALITGKGEAAADVAVATSGRVGQAEAKIASLRETGVLEARDLNTLKKTSGARQRNIVKAKSFKDAIQSGLRSTGVGRKAALFAPIGVWTDQGSFDEIFNSFAEIAARERLKASGELRPTDADVKGMKAAMFGVGLSEEANIQLLNEFIAEQESLEAKLDLGVGGSAAGSATPPTVTTQSQFDAIPSGSLFIEDGQTLRKK